MIDTVEDARLKEIRLTAEVRAALANDPRLSIDEYHVFVHCRRGGLDTVIITCYPSKDEQADKGG